MNISILYLALKSSNRHITECFYNFMFDDIAENIPEQSIQLHGVNITIKRLDLVHPAISGNKFFKLKYNFLEAKSLGYLGVLSFGGAFSNHIAATAFASHQFGFKSIGIIRGEELAHQSLNHTLFTAQQFGMQLEFISREHYRLKDSADFLAQLKEKYPDYYIIPEGGTNDLAIQGCKEILTESNKANFDLICCAVGTGGTISGLIESSANHQNMLGFSALKGDFLTKDVQQLTHKYNWKITDEFCCGGYAKTTPELLQFMQNFEHEFAIPLEQVYTAKMLFGLSQMIQRQEIKPSTRILAIHTGGLQGRLKTE